MKRTKGPAGWVRHQVTPRDAAWIFGAGARAWPRSRLLLPDDQLGLARAVGSRRSRPSCSTSLIYTMVAQATHLTETSCGAVGRAGCMPVVISWGPTVHAHGSAWHRRSLMFGVVVLLDAGRNFWAAGDEVQGRLRAGKALPIAAGDARRRSGFLPGKILVYSWVMVRLDGCCWWAPRPGWLYTTFNGAVRRLGSWFTAHRLHSGVEARHEDQPDDAVSTWVQHLT